MYPRRVPDLGAGGRATGSATDIDQRDYEELSLDDLIVRLVAEGLAALAGPTAPEPSPKRLTRPKTTSRQWSLRVADLPAYRLHPLKGEMAGFWSIRVSRHWRVIFRFQEGDVYDVNLVGFH